MSQPYALPTAAVALFLLELVITLVAPNFGRLFLPRYGRRHRAMGAVYIAVLIVGLTDIAARVSSGSDDEAVALANECDFGLGSNVFGSRRRALKVGAQLNAGMTTINDFCATYMAQSLPFGGVKESGFDRFAGIEGLRGCCNVSRASTTTSRAPRASPSRGCSAA